LEKDDLKRIELILSAARQLNSMIDNLLIMTKMESGKTVLNRVEVDLNNLIATALSEFSSVAASKNIQLNSQLSETSSRVSVDANLLRRVIDNLLSNALKFSHRNSTITLQVDYPSDSVARQSSSVVTGASHTVLKQAIIRVIDEGFGINEDQKQCIFDKYEVGKLMSGVSQIGLGLAFCKMVVEAHGGSIFVEDNQPHGSIFTVIL
jgi:signal transduction histidine kinase